ncbi:MAG: hypothetical protein QF704_14980, partial [Anaerolineales bacterium]|nr:hypothetical protein [Anaerolineales bacterium]
MLVMTLAVRVSYMRIMAYVTLFVWTSIGLVIRLLSPIVLIRFGSLHSEKIGPFASRTELYLCEKEHGIQPNNAFDIFVSSHIDLFCNRQLHTMWKRLLRVNDAFRPLYNTMRLNRKFDRHIIDTTNASRDIHGLLEKTDVHLRFADAEVERAKIELARMGIGEDDEYVLMLNRGQRYLNEMFPERDWKYHEWRNMGIDKLMPAAEILTSRGHSVIRMGHLVSDLMNTVNPAIIEYDEHGYRT